MADSNQNSVTNNVTVESDKVIKFINPFTNHQQHQLDDFSLFLSVSKKCRCCFSKLIDDSDQHTVESWHRQAFLALTGVEMMTPDSENFLCLKCSDILKIYSELGKTAANLQRKYNILMQDLASDVKTEREEIDEISGRLQDCSDIVISDDESVSHDNEQPQKTNSSDTIQNRIHDENVNKCSVRVTRIDPDTIDNFEHCSIVEGTEEQMIDQTSSTTGKSKRTSEKDSETKYFKIFSKAQNNEKWNISGKNSKNMRSSQHAHRTNIKFSCNFCSATFESSAKLRDHKRIVHCKNFKCEECDAAFGKACLLSLHIKAIHNGKRWYCNFQDCSASFCLKSHADQHIQKVHALQDETLINKYLKTEKNDQSNTKCHICGMTSKNMRSLKRHITDHHNTPKVSCDLCGKTFLRKQNIRQHMHTYHMNIKFNCNLCSAEFESSAKLCDHRLTVHYKNFKCEDCDAAFGKACLLSKHIKAMHDGKRWYCHYQDCSTSFSLKKYAKHHFQTAHALPGEEMINKYLKTEKNDQSNTKCQVCGMIAKNQQELYRHFKQTHTDTMKYSCDLCGKTFSHKQKMDLIDHMYKHQMRVKFRCKLCPAEFQSNLKLIFHEKNAHNKKFNCEKCDASFIEPRHLKEHVKVQHEGKRYNCQVPGCSKSYLTIDVARSHLLGTHSLRGEEYRKYSAKLNPNVEFEREDDFKCQICGKIALHRTALRAHVRLVHNKNKSCDFCGKTFSIKKNLIDHMHTHHINLKFDCDLCSLEFRSDKKLQSHKKVAHYKNFKCEECNLAFGILRLLKEHVKVKHEGKRYHCSYPECSTSFARKESAAKHLVVAHSLVGENFFKFKEKFTLQ